MSLLTSPASSRVLRGSVGLLCCFVALGRSPTSDQKEKIAVEVDSEGALLASSNVMVTDSRRMAGVVREDPQEQTVKDADKNPPGFSKTKSSSSDAGSAVEKSGESDVAVAQVNADGSIETPVEAQKSESRWSWGAPKVTPFDSEREGAYSVDGAAFAAESVSANDQQEEGDDGLQTPIEAVVNAARYVTGYSAKAQNGEKNAKVDAKLAAKVGERVQPSSRGGENAPGLARVNREPDRPWGKNVLFENLHVLAKNILELPREVLWLIGIVVLLSLFGVLTCAISSCRASGEHGESAKESSLWSTLLPSSSFSLPWPWRSIRPAKTLKMANDGLLAPPTSGS